MTREEFVTKYRHELGGLILDGCTVPRTGADLALYARQILKKVDQLLVQIHVDMTRPEPVNGQQGGKNATTPAR